MVWIPSSVYVGGPDDTGIQPISRILRHEFFTAVLTRAITVGMFFGIGQTFVDIHQGLAIEHCVQRTCEDECLYMVFFASPENISRALHIYRIDLFIRFCSPVHDSCRMD